MIDIIAATFLFLLGLYAACGLLFAVPFVLVGLARIDPHAARGSWGFRLLILPGAAALWPWLLRRWATGTRQPPVVRTRHRPLAHPAPEAPP